MRIIHLNVANALNQGANEAALNLLFRALSRLTVEVGRALKGLTVNTPTGPMTIRAKDHNATRGQLYGKTVLDPKYPFVIMSPAQYVAPDRFMD